LVFRKRNAQKAKSVPRVKVTASAPHRKPIDVEIARLRRLDVERLRARWQIIFRRRPPATLPRHLMFAMIAYSLQAEVLGDLDAEVLRVLKKIDLAPSKTEITSLTKTLAQRQRQLSLGTVLVREWNGQAHRVMVVEQGFAWQGSTYDSLSKIAQAITGTKWNGPRFFGLRDKSSSETVP
jgi:hypothetical protein